MSYSPTADSSAHGAFTAPVSQPRTDAADPRIWPSDATGFSTHRVGAIRHNLDQHPLMQLPALLALAKELKPGGGCRFLDPQTNKEDATFFHHGDHPGGRSLDDVFEHMEQPGSWIALYNIENVPRYRELLARITDAVRPIVEREQPDIFLTTGFIFISAPPALTPFHIDRENNFWLQLRGRKSITLWNREDSEIVPTAAVENFIVFRDDSGVRMNDVARQRGQSFVVKPGEGMYFPSTTPHMTRTTPEWATPGDGVSISIGVNFYTRTTRRHAWVHQLNRMLRRAGLQPTPPGRSAWRDALKAPLGRAVISLLRWHRKDYQVPPGGV